MSSSFLGHKFVRRSRSAPANASFTIYGLEVPEHHILDLNHVAVVDLDSEVSTSVIVGWVRQNVSRYLITAGTVSAGQATIVSHNPVLPERARPFVTFNDATAGDTCVLEYSGRLYLDPQQDGV